MRWAARKATTVSWTAWVPLPFSMRANLTSISPWSLPCMSLTVSFINYFFWAAAGAAAGLAGALAAGLPPLPSGRGCGLDGHLAQGALGAFGQFLGLADDDVIVVGPGNGAL